MKKIIIPSTSSNKLKIERVKINKNIFIGTIRGLVKKLNEDRLGCLIKGDTLRICIADGHWGKEASKVIVDHWLSNTLAFPTTKQMGLKEALLIEDQLFNLFGSSSMNPNLDFTPEASFIACEIKDKKLSVISYGDCRLLMANKGRVRLKLATRETWLGVFSRMKLRNRIPLKEGLIFKKISLLKEDVVLIFTDGVDQCVYEKETLNDEFLAKQTENRRTETIFDSVIDEVFSKGAEDNASLAVIK